MTSGISKSLSLIGASLLGVHSSADVLEVTRKPLDATTPQKLVTTVLGRRDPIWMFDGSELHMKGDAESKVARLVYVPFRSSEQFCRTYVTTIHSPGWFCEEECEAPKDRTFHIETEAYLGLIPSANDEECSQTDFEADFFALKENLSDREVERYLNLFALHFERWRQENAGSETAELLNSISARDITALDILTEGEVAVVRFVVRDPVAAHPGYRILFDLLYRGQSIVDTRLIRVMP